jgi:hypothetical protein
LEEEMEEVEAEDKEAVEEEEGGPGDEAPEEAHSSVMRGVTMLASSPPGLTQVTAQGRPLTLAVRL